MKLFHRFKLWACLVLAPACVQPVEVVDDSDAACFVVDDADNEPEYVDQATCDEMAEDAEHSRALCSDTGDCWAKTACWRIPGSKMVCWESMYPGQYRCFCDWPT